MPQKKRVLNYFLSMAIILIVVVFLLSLVSISRFVLSDSTIISAHVNDTNTLLEDAEEVGKAAERQEQKNQTIITKEGAFLRLQYKGFRVSDASYLNIRKNRSIFTVILEEPIVRQGDIYYVKIGNYSNLVKGDVVAYGPNSSLRIGEFVSRENEQFVIRRVGTTKLDGVTRDSLQGYVIFQEEK